ncbi:hypothetical protein VPH35_019982 [Triticum aestivum]
MEVLRSKMHALTVSRLEEVVRPLHDMMTALEGWTTLLRGYLERMEVLVGQLGYSPASPQSFEMHISGSVGNVAGVEDFIESDVASCLSEVLASVVHPRDATPVLVSSLPMEEQAEAGGTVACVEAALSRLPVVPLMSPLLELQVGPADGMEACLYGCFSPRAALYTSPLPVRPSVSGSEVVIEGVPPVLQCMPELQVLSVEPSSPISMVLSKVGSLEAMTVASTPSPPPLEPSQPEYAYVEGDGLVTTNMQPLEPFGGVVPMANKIVVARVLVPNPGVLLATKICEFLANLDSENSGKMIGCLLEEKALREKHKNDGANSRSGILKEKSCMSKSKKDSARGEAQKVL